MSKKFRTAAELTAYLEDYDEEIENEILNIITLPPEKVDELSDEENIEDTEMCLGTAGINVIDNIAETCGCMELEKGMENETFTEIPEGPAHQEPANTNAEEIRMPHLPESKWTKRAVDPIESVNLEHEKIAVLVKDHGEKTPFELFSLLMDDGVIELITTESNQYAHQKNAQIVNFSTADIRRFIGILLYSGWAPTPAYRNYWSQDQLLGRDVIKNTMPRNRFDEIKRYFHVANNMSLDTEDKFAKVRPLIEKMNEKFMQFGVFSQHLSIDEQITPYFGQHSCRMFIKNKPVRFGFKLWCLCSSAGYLYKFEPYAGAVKNTDKKKENKLGLGGNVVVSLLRDVNPRQHEVFFGNFFTSRNLLWYLTSIGQVATGTIRKNFKKLERGKHESTNDRSSQMKIVRWNDNSVVTLAFNKYDALPMQQGRRYCRKSKRFNNIDCPNVVSVYNKHMGGVDLHDNAVANYRVNIRGKKWYWPLIITMIDSCVVNAWKLHCVMQKHRSLPQCSLFDYRKRITQQLLISTFFY